MAVPHIRSNDVLLKNLVPLNTLSDEQLGQLLSRIEVEKAKKGQYLFREGDTDHQNIYLLSGTIALLSGHKEMDLVSSGTPTARFALAHQLPRKHSAQAKSAVTYVRIDSRMLSDMLARSQSASYEVNVIDESPSSDWMSLLLQSAVFQQIPPANLQRVMMRMEEIQVSEGDIIISQGDDGDYFYLISKGECSVTRSPEAGHAPVELARLHAGKGFGEEALISDKPRSSTVTMLSDGILVRLNKQDFIELVKQPLSRMVDYWDACKSVENGALWLDVRTPEEYEVGHQSGAINLPFFSLRFQASSLALDRAYIIYGAEVGQSATAAYLLTERGAEVFVLDLGWVELAEQAGLVKREQEAQPQVCNVIDFNRDAEDVSAIKAQVAAQKAEIVELKKTLNEHTSQFQEELKQRHTEVKLLKQALAAAKGRQESSEQEGKEAEQLRQEIDSLRASLQAAESQAASHDELQKEHEKLLGRIEGLEQHLASAREELDSTRSLGDDFRQQGIDLQSQLQQVQDRYEEQKGRLKEEITELSFQLQAAEESRQESDQQAERQHIELERLRGELAELQATSEVFRAQSAEDFSRLSGERFELECALEQLKEERASSQTGNDERIELLQEALEQAREALNQTQLQQEQREAELQQELMQANESARQAAEQFEQEIVALRQSQAEERQALQSQLEAETTRVGELEQAHQSLEERRHSLEKELEAIREAGSEAEAQHHNAMSSLRRDMAQAQQNIEELRLVRQQLESSLQQSQTEAEFVGQQLNQALQAVGQKAEEEQEHIDAALRELNEQLQAAQAETCKQSEKRVEIEALLEQEHQTASFLRRSLKTTEEAVELTEKDLDEAHQSRQTMQRQLAELQQTLANERLVKDQLQDDIKQKDSELAAANEAHEQARQALRAELKEAQAAAQAPMERGEVEAAQRAQQAAESKIEALMHEIEGLREVQLEMGSQLSDDAETEITQLRNALEVEEEKRKKAEKLAQQIDVLRREGQMYEAANEILDNEREEAVRENQVLCQEKEALAQQKEALAQEHEYLAGQMNEIRNQYADLVNENDQLHSEVIALRDQAGGSGHADDLLIQMEELRIKAESYETERDEALSETQRMRREVGELRSVIETYVEQIKDVQSLDDDKPLVALRNELDMVRQQAHEDLEQMRLLLRDAESRSGNLNNRDVNDVATQQAVRQEMFSMQQALSEKDHLLRRSQHQCRGLEDAIEDRDKEVDQLKRKLEMLLRKTGGLDDSSLQQGAREVSDSSLRDNSRHGEGEQLGSDSDTKKKAKSRLFRKNPRIR